MARIADISRKTKETDIALRLCLDGGGVSVDTGIGFFDHMLTALAFYGGFGLSLTVRGDLQVDGHHTVEDTGIVLGQAVRKSLGDKEGIRRFGSAYVPMDEALCFTALDCSGRAFLVFDAKMPQEQIGGYDACLTVEFMRALAFNAGITLHQRAFYGENAHHITEGLFKSLGLAMKDAIRVEGTGVTSTKGVL
ncbi:MAG: Imidazoleglycerol-phosphate dehydratase [Oscillospiraceae bacterium]|nr:Imidazoleglycerol-phosphate dehydratase [Oscillospiraceae bacterium]